MKKSNDAGPGPEDPARPGAPAQPDKLGWLRKFCGRGIFRELWRSRYVLLRGERLFVSDKEVKDERKWQEVWELANYERAEELRKAKSRSKKDHSRFTLVRRRRPGNTVPNLLFLAVGPEEKESWIAALNVAIVKAKNGVLDQVTAEEDALVHPTRDRAKIPQGRRLPTRGHLSSAASSSRPAAAPLDLVAEEEGFSSECDGASWGNVPAAAGGRRRSGTDVSKLRVRSEGAKVQTGSLPRGSERSWGENCHSEKSEAAKGPPPQALRNHSRTPQPGKRSGSAGRSRCASMDEVLSSRPAAVRSELRSAQGRRPAEEERPAGQLQSLIAQKMQRAQELLEEIRLQELQKATAQRERAGGAASGKGVESPRLQHLRAGGSPRSRSSPSPGGRRRGHSPGPRRKESPRARGRESPRSEGPKNADSPRSRGSRSPKTGEPSSGAPGLREAPLVALGSEGGPADSPLRSSARPGGAHDRKTCPGAEEEEEGGEEELRKRRAEAERLLSEAMCSWREAREVLQEVKELQSHTLRRQRRRTYEKTAPSRAASPRPAGDGRAGEAAASPGDRSP